MSRKGRYGIRFTRARVKYGHSARSGVYWLQARMAVRYRSVMAVVRGLVIFLVAVLILDVTYALTPASVRAAVRPSAAAQACGQALSFSTATAAAAE
jgi:hypothetical protein